MGRRRSSGCEHGYRGSCNSTGIIGLLLLCHLSWESQPNYYIELRPQEPSFGHRHGTKGLSCSQGKDQIRDVQQKEHMAYGGLCRQGRYLSIKPWKLKVDYCYIGFLDFPCFLCFLDFLFFSAPVRTGASIPRCPLAWLSHMKPVSGKLSAATDFALIAELRHILDQR